MKIMNKHSMFLQQMTLALAIPFLGSVNAYAQCHPEQIAKLLADDGAEGDLFGNAIAISGTTAIVGAFYDDVYGENSGSAYLFDVKTGQQLFKLLPNDGAEGDWFGHDVGISGTIAIVGARYDQDNGFASGSAYLFDTTTGQQINKVIPTDNQAGDQFGFSVDIHGNIVIIGANTDDDNGPSSGSAYLFDVSTGQQLSKLLPEDGAEGDFFGVRVAISETTAIVGASRDDDNGTNSGSAYLFDVTTGQQLHKLLPDDGAAGDFFAGVGISETTAIVGAAGHGDNGAAYLFDITTGQQLHKLLPDDGEAGDGFGGSGGYAISGNTAIVGAPGDDDDGEESGSAYLFDVTTGKQFAKFIPDDGEAGDRFGGLAISGTTAIVGALRDDDNGQDSGSAYLFDISDCVVVVEEVAPESFTVTRGDYVSGSVADLAASDNLDLSVRRSVADIQSRTEFTVNAFSPTASPASLEVTLEGAVFPRLGCKPVN